MTKMRVLRGAALLLGLAGIAGPAAAAAKLAPTLSALATVRPGLWQVSGDGQATRSLCLADPIALVQVRHAQALCTRFVIADGANGATVHYSCPGQGWGRTSLHTSSPDDVRIDTQGIAENAPFAFTAQAHRTGACPSGSASLRR